MATPHWKLRRAWKFAALLVGCGYLGGGVSVQAWVSEAAWELPSVTLSSQLSDIPTPPLTDGAESWNALVEEAVSIWNVQTPGLNFEAAVAAGVSLDFGNGRNDVVWSESIGQSLGQGVLAVTFVDSSGSIIEETDVIFNSRVEWDSYRGPLGVRGENDFLRVAIHEFGHVIGLDHPDEARQRVEAIMNSVISDTDTLQPDDISGAHALYPVVVPEGWFDLGVYGWCFEVDPSLYWSETYGWLWLAPEDPTVAWSFVLNGWTYGDEASGRIWTAAYGWLTALGGNWYASVVGPIYGSDLNGWVWSATYGWVITSYNPEWFWVDGLGWVNP